MAILCKSHNILFIMTPRTACSAIGKTLIQELDGKYFPKQSVTDSSGNWVVDYKHCTLDDLITHNLLSENQLKSLFIFAGVRNPFDSLASLYAKKRSRYQSNIEDPNSWVHKKPGYLNDLKFCKTHSFDEWIKKNYQPTIKEKLLRKGKESMFRKYVNQTNMIIRFESLQQDFQTVLQQAGISKDLEIPLFNRTSDKKRNYRDYYSSHSREIVEYVFGPDSKRFGYNF